MPIPPPARFFPTEDETADDIEAHAGRFALPGRLDRLVEALAF